MRTLWTGSISFGLVFIPVRLYTATQSHTLDLDMLHKKDLSPVRYAKMCREEEKEITQDEIVKGYEYTKGEYVILTDKEIKGAMAARSESIDIIAFTDEKGIDTIYYDRPYYLEPDKGADKVYVLLREALEKSGKVGLAKFVFRQREHLVVIKPSDNMLVLNQLRFADEVRDPSDLKIPEKSTVGKQELGMAIQLIEDMSQPFRAEDFEDSYRAALDKLIEEKAEGRVPVATPEKQKTGKVLDLMTALKESLKEQEASKSEERKSKTSTAKKSAAGKKERKKPAGKKRA